MSYLLDIHPPAINYECGISEEGIAIIEAYPLHLACLNESCPNEVVQLLITKSAEYSDQFKHLLEMAIVDFDWGHMDYYHQYGGTPLHYYLSRRSNVDLGIVKQLVNDPDILTPCDEMKCSPIHVALFNVNVNEMYDVIEYLVKLNPSCLQARDEFGQTPLHMACMSTNITAKIVELLLKICPESVHQQTSYNSGLPLHTLCERKFNDEVAIDILKLLLETHPESISAQYDELDDVGDLPLHAAASYQSSAFCKVLADAYPESVRRKNTVPGYLPFHKACKNGWPDTVKYLFGLYPESLHIRNDFGHLPIHVACESPKDATLKTIEFLLIHDPECISKTVLSDEGNEALPLHLVCSSWDQSDGTTELIFDLYPEALLIRNEQGKLPIDLLRERLGDLPVNNETGKLMNEAWGKKNEALLVFFSTQMSYAHKAQDRNAMRTIDSTGSLPLHNALQARASLGSIKLLVKGNPDAINISDGNGMLPLDIASEVSTVGIVKYLAELSPDLLNACDVNKNYPLHHACRGGNCEVISYLLKTPMSSASVSERNVDDMLPIHLFCEFARGRWCEGETPEYTETIWRLLTAYPETVLNW